jgi:hypothetical protein
MSTTLDTNTRYVRENGILYKECNAREENAHPTGNPAIPYFKQGVVDMIPVEGANIQYPCCEHLDSEPHTAQYSCVWEQRGGGRHVKFMCEDHCENIGSQPYWVSKLIGLNYQQKPEIPMKLTPALNVSGS